MRLRWFAECSCPERRRPARKLPGLGRSVGEWWASMTAWDLQVAVMAIL